MQKGSVLSPFLFTVVVDVVTEFARDGVLSVLLNANGLVLMSETIKGLRNKFLRWNDTFGNKALKVNLGKTNIMVSGGITKGGFSKSNVDPCGVFNLRVKANSVLLVRCGILIDDRCARVI